MKKFGRSQKHERHSAIAISSPGGPKRSSLGQIKKPSVDATPWCYTGTKEDTNFSFDWTIENLRCRSTRSGSASPRTHSRCR